MTYSRDAKEVIRMALISAIDDRESFIDAYGGIDPGDGCVDDARALVRDWRVMLKRRYAYRAIDPLEGSVSVDVKELWEANRASKG